MNTADTEPAPELVVGLADISHDLLDSWAAFARALLARPELLALLHDPGLVAQLGALVAEVGRLEAQVVRAVHIEALARDFLEAVSSQSSGADALPAATALARALNEPSAEKEETA